VLWDFHRINKKFWGQTVRETGKVRGHNSHEALSKPEAMALLSQEASCGGEKFKDGLTEKQKAFGLT
jgi:hypothetical protein